MENGRNSSFLVEKLKKVPAVCQVIPNLLKATGIEFEEMIEWLKTREGAATLKEAVAYVGKQFITANTAVHIAPPAVCDISVWKTVGRSTNRRTSMDYQRALSSKECKVTTRGNKLLEKYDLLAGDGLYDFYILSARNLGFTGNVSAKEFYEAAFLKGYHYGCPAWAGPELLVAEDVHKGWLRVGVAAKVGGRLDVFLLGHVMGIHSHGNLLLGGDHDYGSAVWSPDDFWICVRSHSE